RDAFVLASNVGGFPHQMLQSNLASLDAGASAKPLVSGPATADQKISYILDDDPETCWEADPADKETVLLVDLGDGRQIERMSMMHTARPGKILVYALENLPNQKAEPAKLAWLEQFSDVP